MAYRRKTTRRAYSGGGARRGSGYSRAPARSVRRSAPKRPARRRAAVASRPQRVVIEMVYRDGSEVARPQGVVETRQGTKPKL